MIQAVDVDAVAEDWGDDVEGEGEPDGVHDVGQDVSMMWLTRPGHRATIIPRELRHRSVWECCPCSANCGLSHEYATISSAPQNGNNEGFEAP